MANLLDMAIRKIANNIDASPGWHAAGYFLNNGVIDEREHDMLVDFDGIASDGGKLTKLQLNARSKINAKILATYSDLDLFEIGINVDELTISKNGWRR